MIAEVPYFRNLTNIKTVYFLKYAMTRNNKSNGITKEID